MVGRMSKVQQGNELLKRLMRNSLFVVGFAIVVVLVILAALGSFIVVHDPLTPHPEKRLLPPTGLASGWRGHLLGADPLGRDVLTRLIIGSRYSLAIGISAVLGSLFIGTVVGMLAGFYGGVVDNVVMRIADVQLSIPSTLLAIAVIALLGPNLVNLVIVLVITSWPTYARLIRANVLVIKQAEFIASARLIGGSDTWIMTTQVLPNVLTPLLILATQQVGFQILMEAALSFLGLGVQPPTPSWGRMIADGRQYIASAPWVVLSPGLALMITVLGFNFLGDGLRDVLDPKLRV